jgi:glycosyltransferase involved in cell wall biosynthesis
VSAPPATVVIPTRNRCATLVRVLDALLPQVCAAGADVVVADNGSTDGTAEALARVTRAAGPVLHTVHEPLPGATRARNAGIRAARGHVLAFTDDDALPAGNWLAALLAGFTDPSLGVAGGRVALRFEDVRPPWWSEPLATYLAAYDLGPAPLDLGRRPSGDSPRGLNMAVRRTALAEVGGFSVRLGPVDRRPSVGEESDLCLRLLARGWNIRYEPAAVVEHLVDPARLHPEWFFRRAFWTGWSEAMIALGHGSMRAALGKLRWHYRLRALRRPRGPGAPPDVHRVRAECERREAVGYVLGLLRWAPARWRLASGGPR